MNGYPARDPALGITHHRPPGAVLAFDERLGDANAILDAHADALRASRPVRGEVAAVAALFEFYDGDLDSARVQLERVAGHNPPRAPILRAVHFCLAAVVRRQGRRGGGDLFVVRWAVAR